MAFLAEICRFTHDSATNVASVTVPVVNAAPVGTRIILAVATNPNTAVTGYTVTDTKGNTWTQRSLQIHATPNNCNLGVMECIVTTALTTSDTLTVGNTSSLRSPAIWLVAAEGFDDLSAGFDVQASATGTSTSPASGASATTAQARELVFGAIGGTANPAVTLGTGSTGPSGGALTTTVTTRFLAVEWKYVTTTGAQNATAVLGGANGWCAAVDTFKQDAPPLVPACYLVTSSGDKPMDITVA